MKNTKKFGKRVLALVLAVMMCVSLLNLTVFAKEVDGGSKTISVGATATFTVPTDHALRTWHDETQCTAKNTHSFDDYQFRYTDGVRSAMSITHQDSGVDASLNDKVLTVTGTEPGSHTVTVSYTVEYKDVEGVLKSQKCDRCSNSWTYGGETNFSYSYSYTVDVQATYTLNFDANGGSVTPASMTETVAAASYTFTNLPTPTREGHTFKGWADSADATEAQYQAGSSVTLNWVSGSTVEKTVYAVWEPITYTVIFDSNGGSAVDSQTVNHGGKATEPADPTRAGWDFEGWYLDGEKYDFDTPVTSDITLKAKWSMSWTPVVPVTYTVTFDSNGGSAVDTQTVENGEKATEPADPTRAGWDFEGWYLDGEKYDFDTPVTSDITLKAKWSMSWTPVVPVTYTVTFDSNGGSAVDSQTVENGEKATEPDEPTRAGWDFEGWYLDGEKYDFDTPVTSDITLKAKWSMSWTPVVPVTYTVTFDSNGGSAVASQTVENGEKATEPDDPTREGYTFNGWTLNGEAYDFDTAVTADITLVAQWTRNSTGGGSNNDDYYTLTINYVDTEGNTVASSVSRTMLSGSYYSVTSPAVTGYTPNRAVVTGTLTGNRTVTVVYTAITIEAEPTEYTLTINYVDEDGNVVAESYSAKLEEGTDYSVASPEIENMVANLLTVAGTLTEDTVVTVTYYALEEDVVVETPPLSEQPEEEDLDDSNVPLSEEPDEEEDLDDTNVPLSEEPDEEEDLDDTDVPLDASPETGDSTRMVMWTAMLLVSGVGMVALIGKKEEDEEA